MSRFRLSLLACVVLFHPGLMPANGATADDDWARVVALDAGPQEQLLAGADARGAAIVHLDKQERALRAFLVEHGSDAHVFEARLRLARLLQIRGAVHGTSKSVDEASRILDSLGKSATPEQRVEVDFARVTLLMRTLRPGSTQQRDRLLAAARDFQRTHPGDRRVAPLLAEVAPLFLLQPKTMRALLADADASATEAELKGRIADDLRRLDLIGQTLPLEFTDVDGKKFEIEQTRGSVVALVFFAVWSPPSIATLEKMQAAVASLAKQPVKLVGVSLDTKLEPLTALIRAKGLTGPVGYDGKGWESPIIRAFGINALPTVWLLDRQGRVRSLDGSESPLSQFRQLLGER